ncbi:unnamed protein product [Aphis gossypii]|uniref:Uncharacterized protein n=1 Tax=Aphis gossypii TaxID=80765 RepID=A0A9P0IXN6_APHGO|nr:unnamed protein product [Aphis gossypii]
MLLPWILPPPSRPSFGGGGGGRSPAKSKLTCACVSRGDDAQGSGRLPSAVASSPHRRRIDLCRPFNPTRRHLPSAFSTLPPLLPLECYVCGLPSSPPYNNNNNIISYTRHRQSTRWQTFDTRKNKFLFRPTALQRVVYFYFFVPPTWISSYFNFSSDHLW